MSTPTTLSAGTAKAKKTDLNSTVDILFHPMSRTRAPEIWRYQCDAKESALIKKAGEITLVIMNDEREKPVTFKVTFRKEERKGKVLNIGVVVHVDSKQACQALLSKNCEEGYPCLRNVTTATKARQRCGLASD